MASSRVRNNICISRGKNPAKKKLNKRLFVKKKPHDWPVIISRNSTTQSSPGHNNFILLLLVAVTQSSTFSLFTILTLSYRFHGRRFFSSTIENLSTDLIRRFGFGSVRYRTIILLINTGKHLRQSSTEQIPGLGNPSKYINNARDITKHNVSRYLINFGKIIHLG